MKRSAAVGSSTDPRICERALAQMGTVHYPAGTDLAAELGL
ncbi:MULTISPECIES: hypothetical protein [Micrococcaceae]|nr:hypothetical protein [Glutamicibacter sp. BW78]